MSTKIYNGWRWRKALGFFEMVEKIEKAARQEAVWDLKKMVVSAELSKPGARKHRYEWAQLVSRLIQAEAYRMERGIGINRVYYIRDAGEHYLLVPQDTRQRHGSLYRIEGLEDFRFWNNTDPPDDVPSEEWNVRGEFWDRYWDSKSACVEISALDRLSPYMDVADIVCPDMFQKEEVREDYWNEEEKK